jgi:hypothetical protein
MPKKFTKERKISDAKPIIFLEGVQFTVCPIIMIPKKYPSKDRNGNSVHLGDQVIDLSVRCSFTVYYFSVSRLYPLPKASIVQT